MTRTAALKTSERILRGSELRLPLVESLGAIHSRSASRITWHAHAKFEILCLVEGATEYEFADGRRVPLPGGHFVLIPPHVRHRGLHNVRLPARLCGIVFDPNCRGAATNTPFTPRDLGWIGRQFAAHAGQPWPMGRELRHLAASLVEQVQDFDSTLRDSAAGLRLTTCSVLLEATRQLTTARPIQPDVAVHAAMEYLQLSYGGSTSMSEVARAIGCSRARLFQIFKQAVGMTPNDYLQRLRLIRAAELLSGTDRPITEIAMTCGFTTSQYFSNVFRKYHNLTPTAFRSSSQRAPSREVISTGMTVASPTRSSDAMKFIRQSALEVQSTFSH